MNLKISLKCGDNSSWIQCSLSSYLLGGVFHINLTENLENIQSSVHNNEIEILDVKQFIYIFKYLYKLTIFD